MQAFLARSRKAVRNQRWLRWFGAAAAVAVMILAVVAYYSMLRTRQKEKELATVQIAQGSLSREQEALKEQLKGLTADKGATHADRDRIAKERAAVQEQLNKSQQDSDKLEAQTVEASMLLVQNVSIVKTLQSQLAAAQSERDAAVKARQAAEANSAQLAKNLAQAQEALRLVNEARQQAEAKLAQPVKAPESAPAPPVVLPETASPVANKAPAPPTQSVKPPMTNRKDGLIYVWIPPGSFTMGCSPGDKECEADEKPHAEQIANGFWLSQTEVTQAAWKKVKGNNPSQFIGNQLPVEHVDWNEAGVYCKAIGGRLPIEKEWEYAARAGTTDARYGELDAIGWYRGNSGAKPHTVRLKQANAFGLYDMLGNVFEWTDTNYDGSFSFKVVRGGSWSSDSIFVRASARIRLGPEGRDSGVGFRCVWEQR